MASVQAFWRPEAPGESREHPGPWVEVTDAREAHRLHNKGRFGHPLAGGGLGLHPLEALYLEGIGRLELEGARSAVASSHLAAYSDLRERGLVVKPEAGTDASHLRVWSREGDPRGPPGYHLHPVEERETFSLDEAIRQAQEASRRGVSALAGVVDEEGGLTYFELSLPVMAEGDVDPVIGSPAPARSSFSSDSSDSSAKIGSSGSSPSSLSNGLSSIPPTGPSLLTARLQDELLTVEEEGGREALEAHGYGRRIGNGYKLSLLEGLFLAQEGSLRVREEEGAEELPTPALAWRVLKLQPDLPLRLAVYRLLRTHGYLPKTGFKFGTHFRVYHRPMGRGHAPWLIHAHPSGHEQSWPELARMVRLTHGVRKRLWLARVTGEAAEAALRGEQADPDEGGVRLLEVGWTRP